MIKAMGEVGQRFQDGKAFVPQLLMAGRAMKGALELLKPLLAGSASTTIGKIVIGTVKGDLHDIGKNLVASMLEGCGFEVINIGIDVTCDKFVEAVKEMGGCVLLTADHGNADKMVDDDGTPFTAPTTNPVPFCVINHPCQLREGGRLADIAPTMLKVLGLEQPAEMTGESIIL